VSALLRFARLLNRLGRDQCGASITELALAAPLLTLFVTGAIDLGDGLSQRFTLQQSVDRSLEMLQAGPVEGDADEADVNYDFLIDEAAAAAEVPASQVTLRKWLECDNAPQTHYEDSCDPGEETARYVELRIDKVYDGQFFLGDYPMTASAAMRIQ
jgi:Flp pilus assembly protein TadG